MASAVLFDRQPLARTVRWRIVANVLSIGFVVRKCFQCSAAAWCRDRLAGAEELSGVGERPFRPVLPLDPDRAVQAQPGPPPSYSAPAAQGHELAGLRRQLTPAGCDLSCQLPITPGGWRRKAREGVLHGEKTPF